MYIMCVCVILRQMTLICVSVYMHAHMYIPTMCVSESRCMHVCMYVRMYVCMYAMYVYVCMHACLYGPYVCTYTCMHTCIYIHINK